MKKIIAIIGLSVACIGAFGQGTVNFINTSATLISTNGATTGALANVANQYVFAILTAPMVGFGSPQTSANITDGTWTFDGIYGNNIAAYGRFSGGNNVATTTGWGAGVTNSYVIVGWSANLGATWSSISNQLASGSWSANGYFGVSSIAFGMAGGGPSSLSPFGLFGTGPVAAGTPLTSGFTLYAVSVPEPSTIALAGLGAASLLLFRRRK